MEKHEIIKLDWDSDFFEVDSAKLILKEPLLQTEWIDIKEKIKSYKFVTLVNQNSNPINSMIIGKDLTAYLVDVNIQLKKTVCFQNTDFESINLLEDIIEINLEEILDIVEFPFSRFIDDPNIPIEKSQSIYKEWIKNSINDKRKFFIISKNELGKIDGLILFSINNENKIVIELISVYKHSKKSGIGTKMFITLENHAHTIGVNEILVGTQVKNERALNFYHKLGFRQIECHQIFHMWN